MRAPSRNRATRCLPSSPRAPRATRSRIGLAVAAALASAAAPRAPALAAAAAGDLPRDRFRKSSSRRASAQRICRTFRISIDVFTSEGPAESRHHEVRRLRAEGAVHLLHQRGSGHADLRHARRLRRQQSELRQQLRDRFLPRRQLDELVRRCSRTCICTTSSASRC